MRFSFQHYKEQSGPPTTSPAPASQCAKSIDKVDYPGNDIAQTNRANHYDCCNDCAHTEGCAGYVWASWNAGTCFLKSKLAEPSPYAGAKAAAQKICQAPQDNVDYYGNDIDSIAGAKEDCCGICKLRNGCVGYTHFDGICWLKGQIGRLSYKYGATSASL
ncbi:unnamed protein product [Aphanomyces euteiches]